MIRNTFTFLGTFVVGALVALVARAAWFNPHHAETPAATGGDYAPMVSNSPAAPSAGAASAPAKPAATARPTPADPHAGHGAAAAPAAGKSTAGKPVNTVCAICGMEVDPKLATLEYKGKTIGFGCKMCAPKFKADPERYGPVYLRNEVIKK